MSCEERLVRCPTKHGPARWKGPGGQGPVVRQWRKGMGASLTWRHERG
jgi:hypothetical protein